MDNIQIDPREVKQWLDRGDTFLLVDVRESWEYDICKIAGSKLVPLRELPANLAVFDGASEVVVYCHSGMRSLDAATFLRSQGVEKARSMSGGIERWSTEIDPTVPRY